MTLSVSPELERKLTDVAGRLRRDPQTVLEEAVSAYLDDEASFLGSIQESRASLARGEGIPHAQVIVELDAIIADAERRQ